ncbi:MAG: hypothetical protein KJ968_03325 [Nanoarchaeota archaeon]|nr:hypothetical protein [Nanoarchaeota archaeon]
MKTKEDSIKSRENHISFYSKLSDDEKKLFRKSANLILPEKRILTFNDLIQFEKVKELLLPIKKKYKINLNELLTIIKEQVFFPVSVLNKKLTILESVVKYLKEEKEFSLRKISEVIGRDERNIWHIYNRTRKKYPKKFVIKKTKFWIPVEIFSDKKLSALEAIVSYLKEEFSLTYHEIALLLKRDDRTVWTVYQRARKKNAKPK